jgi:hypothetical protein
MGEQRADWLQSVRRARLHGHALNRVGEQIGQLKNRLRGLRLRRDELFEELMARPLGGGRGDPLQPMATQGQVRTAEQPRTVTAHPEPPHTRPWLEPLRYTEEALAYENARRRFAVLDRAQLRYMTTRDGLEDNIRLRADEKANRIAAVDRRLAACRQRKRELVARIARGRDVLPEGVTFTDAELADLRDMRRVFRTAIEEQLEAARLPGLSPAEREKLAQMALRAERLEKGIGRYRSRVATLTDPDFEVPASGPPQYAIADPKERAATLAAVRQRLSRAEVRHRALADALAANRILTRPEGRVRDWRFIREPLEREKDAGLSVEERDRRERDLLDRAYRQARSRADSLSLGR